MSTTVTEHLTDVEIDELAQEFDAIRAEIEASRGENDAAYIRRVIKAQRTLEAAGRGTLLFSLLPPAWLAGTAMLSVAKILENMEIGHNVMHGQWDWMRDPEIHSSTWQWDNVSPAEGWKYSHNYIHHTFTNVLGKDRDVGYTILRVSPDQKWHPVYLAQPIYNALLAAFFEWGVALHDLEAEEVRDGSKSVSKFKQDFGRIWRHARRQLFKDYVAFPLLSGPSVLTTLTANFTANIVRNVWAHSVIFCGHFPNGVEMFEEEQLEGESKGEWYVRQLLGSANIDGSKLLHLMTGNLSHQIEHHLFPDLPSNRYAEIAPRVRELCERYGLAYTSGSLPKQVLNVWGRIVRLAFPGGGTAEQPGTGSAPARQELPAAA